MVSGARLPPSQRDRYRDEVEIRWDHPIKLVRVNRVGDRGVGDVFAAVPWAAAYKRFLEAWSQLTASLSRFAYQVRTRGDRVADAAAKLARANAEAGQNITTDPNTYLEAVGKSGATIDSESGRPLAAMVAAALDLPVTTLLGDPGVTGARATAESVTDASWPVFDVRQQMWGSVLRDVCSWVIDSAVISPPGPCVAPSPATATACMPCCLMATAARSRSYGPSGTTRARSTGSRQSSLPTRWSGSLR